MTFTQHPDGTVDLAIGDREWYGIPMEMANEIVAEYSVPIVSAVVSESGVVTVKIVERGRAETYSSPAWDFDDFYGEIWDTWHSATAKHCACREIKRKLMEWDAERLGLPQVNEDRVGWSWMDCMAVVCIWLALMVAAWVVTTGVGTSW